MIIYELISEFFEDGEYGRYESFGIAARREEDGFSTLVDSLSDISCDRALVESLVCYCNERRIPPFFVSGVAEDFIG